MVERRQSSEEHKRRNSKIIEVYLPELSIGLEGGWRTEAEVGLWRLHGSSTSQQNFEFMLQMARSIGRSGRRLRPKYQSRPEIGGEIATGLLLDEEKILSLIADRINCREEQAFLAVSTGEDIKNLLRGVKNPEKRLELWNKYLKPFVPREKWDIKEKFFPVLHKHNHQVSI